MSPRDRGNNRRARFYRLTGPCRRQLAKEAGAWEETTALVARFLEPRGEPT